MDIDFKARTIDNKGWVFGDVLKSKIIIDLAKNERYCLLFSKDADLGGAFRHLLEPNKYINANNVHKVIPESIVQYLGISDKYKKRLYNGDIIQFGPDKDGIILQLIWNGISDNGYEILKQKDKNVGHDIRLYRCDKQATFITNIFDATPKQKKEWNLE